MRYGRLGTDGPLVSQLGFGASPLGGIYGAFAEQDGIDAVHCTTDGTATDLGSFTVTGISSQRFRSLISAPPLTTISG